jgi:hypothetical protein
MLTWLRRPLFSPAIVIAVATLALAVTGFTVAFAGSGSDGTLSACAAKKSGTLRLVKAGKKCHKTEQKVTWNQQGVPGPPGVQGVPGIQGIQGIQGPPNAPAVKLWAAVQANGALARGLGVVSTVQITTGLYEVTFNQNVSACGFIASLGSPGALNIPAGSAGTSQNIGGGFSNLPSQVLVSTTTSAGAGADRAFFLAVVC